MEQGQQLETATLFTLKHMHQSEKSSVICNFDSKLFMALFQTSVP